jgi:putative ABC transport system permease protein
MRWLYKLPLRLRSLFKRGRVEQELSDELRFHLEKLTEENFARGMTPEEARYAALRELGGLEQIKEERRDMRQVNYIESFFQDLCYSSRVHARYPGFTTVAVLALALGIGANTAIFSVVNRILLRPLPFADPVRLVQIYQSNMQKGYARMMNSSADIEDAWRQNTVFEDIAVFQRWAATLRGAGEPEQIASA